MASGYPGSRDNFNTGHVDPPAPGSPETIRAATINDLADAVNKIEQELGINPSDIYTDILTRLGVLEFFTPNVVSTATYTLSAADRTVGIVCTPASGTVVTVPASTTWNAPFGTVVPIRAGTVAGTVSVVGAAGVTIRNPFSSFQLAAQAAQAQLLNIGPDVWSLNGEVL